MATFFGGFVFRAPKKVAEKKNFFLQLPIMNYINRTSVLDPFRFDTAPDPQIFGWFFIRPVPDSFH